MIADMMDDIQHMSNVIIQPLPPPPSPRNLLSGMGLYEAILYI